MYPTATYNMCCPSLRNCLLSALAMIALVFALQRTVNAAPMGALGYTPAMGAFVTCVTKDNAGRIWVGTEDNGVWCCSGGRTPWVNFTTKNGLPEDDVYALVCDRLGRIWAGFARHGVAVWNGATWTDFNAVNGPLSDHVYALAVSPVDGDVWISTSSGLARYSQTHGTWSYVTRAHGLPSDQITSLAFDSTGLLVAGTACSGLAFSRPASGYQQWRQVKGSVEMPHTAAGADLSSALINTVLVTSRGILAGTPWGLSYSSDHGQTWAFIRGANWLAREKKREISRPTAPLGNGVVLADDWITALQEDPATGNLWIGTREAGISETTPGFSMLYPLGQDSPKFDVSSILPVAGGVIFGTYGGGLVQLGSVSAPTSPSPLASESGLAVVEPPKPAAPPTAADLNTRAVYIAKAKPTQDVFGAVYMGEDWDTRGDWPGRYGWEYAKFCAAQSNSDDEISSPAAADFSLDAEAGPHRKDGDTYGGVYSWLQWAHSEAHETLFDPVRQARRQGEWNDGGFSYDTNWEGPDIWLTVHIPAGWHKLSLYFYNKDGHDGDNRFRDYPILVKPYTEKMEDEYNYPSFARARVTSFWNGVYETFALQGPVKYRVEIGSNHSHVALVCGVFLDRFTPKPGIDCAGSPDYLKLNSTETLIGPDPAPGEPELLTAARGLWKALDDAGATHPALDIAGPERMLCYRAAAAANAPHDLLAAWRKRIGLWTADDDATAPVDEKYAPATP